MSGIFETISTLDSSTGANPAYYGSIVNFSNTSNDRKWFSISVEDLIGVLTDMLTSIVDFKRAGTQYKEDVWRDAFSRNIQNEVPKALAATQTLPFFQFLAKVIYAANPGSAYADRSISLDDGYLKNAILKLEEEKSKGYKSSGSKISGSELVAGTNKLFYGAPGTGKSHRVDEDSKALAGEFIVRTIFHPDMQNADFIGALKPKKSGEKITYEFSPGPFAKSVALAARNPDKNIVLIVEELNRAPAAAVFGELFLLLDRNDIGQSKYDLDFPSEEFAEWFAKESAGHALTISGKLYLPQNLSIFATMNSADQGVHPLDTAFRRRWRSEYIALDYKRAPEGNINVVMGNDNVQGIRWATFVETLNDFLDTHFNVEEDRLIGPWFLSAEDLKSESLPGKILIYLWDDLLRHGERGGLFISGLSNYGKLNSAVDKGQRIFSDAFLKALSEAEAAALPAK